MKVLVCPDKFKGSLSADEVCDAITLGLRRFDKSIEVLSLPLADGGEGALDVLEANLKTERVRLTVNDPLFRQIETYYLIKGKSAYIEMAMASGLQLLKSLERNPLETSTFGTGEMIRHALDRGAEDIYLMIGGSATNDGGVGMASALGFEFVTSDGTIFKPVGGDLNNITQVLSTDKVPAIGRSNFTILSDVQNVLLGTKGATFVYGPQKGADADALGTLDSGLANLANILNNGYENVEGAGAAGGLGYGAMSFLNAKVQSGIDTVMDLTRFDHLIDGVDLVITGEGRLDAQSMEGKVVSGVLKRVKVKNIPIGIICGRAEEEFDSANVYQVFELAKNIDDAMINAAHYVEQLAYNLISTRS